MTTKKQHLVWRDYLAPWTSRPNSTNGSIACFYKNQNRIIEDVGIENIGVEGYAYDVSMINEIDKKIIVAYLSNWLKNNSDLNVKSITVNTKDIFKRDYIEKCFICPIEDNGQSILKSLYNLEFPFTGPTKIEILIQLHKIIIYYQLYGLYDEKEFL